VLTVLYAGVATGAVYALVALGINLIYLPTGVQNFAQAQFLALGALLSYSALVTWHWVWPAALALAIVGPAAVALLEEGIVVRVAHKLKADTHTALVSTLGFGVALEGLAGIHWGYNPLGVPFPGPKGVVTILSGRIQPVELITILFAIVVTITGELAVHRTRVGLRFAAVAQDVDAARVLGINAGRINSGAFMVAGGVAGAAGFLLAPVSFASADLGSEFLLYGFVAVAIGGFGSQVGCLVGGLLLGLIEGFATYEFGGGYTDLIAFIVLLVVLVARPTGLFGRTRLRTV